MTIEKIITFPPDEEADYLVTCDAGDSPSCHGALDIEFVLFDEAIEKIKEAEWQIYKREGHHKWLHRCPVCREAKKRQAMKYLRSSAQGE